MFKKQLILLLIFTYFSSGFCTAQKLKYKDLFYLLNAKKYDEAEPFLKSFLSNPKEADHPNANFQMAIIYHEKSKTNDILIDTENKIMNIDSAINYYDKAKVLITEKEIKRHDEYYEDYYRRDLRTGKMGIKMSDVHLDIETRVADLKSSKEKIISLKNYFVRASDFYSKAQKGYKNLVSNYETQKQFFLQSDEAVIEQLIQIKDNYDSSMGNFGRYKIQLQKLEFPGYMQVLKVKQIADIKTEGLDEANFLKSTVSTWNFNKWSLETEKKIKSEVLPLHNSLIDYDKELNILYEKVENDSISVITELSELKDDDLKTSIAVLDDNPFPIALFGLKKAELKYMSDKLELKKIKDSVNVDKQLELTSKSLESINDIDSLINKKLTEYDLSKEALNYKPLIDKQYSGIEGLNAFVQSKRELVINHKKEIESDLEKLKEKSKWLIFKTDSIPLFNRDSSYVITLNSDKTYIHFDKLSLSDTLSFAYGINYDFNGKPSVYFSRVSPTHITEELKEFEIDPTTFAVDSISSIKATKIMDDEMNTYILLHSKNYYNQPIQGHLFRVQNNLTLTWENSITLIYPPDVLTISNDFGVVAINYNLQYIDKSKGLQLISRELYNMLTGESIKEKK